MLNDSFYQLYSKNTSVCFIMVSVNYVSLKVCIHISYVCYYLYTWSLHFYPHEELCLTKCYAILCNVTLNNSLINYSLPHIYTQQSMNYIYTANRTDHIIYKWELIVHILYLFDYKFYTICYRVNLYSIVIHQNNNT